MDPKKHEKNSFRSTVIGLWIIGEVKDIEVIHTCEFFRTSRKTIRANFVYQNGSKSSIRESRLKNMKIGIAINFSSSFGLSSNFFP
jgi:hypothetical protein